jgi:hypothetical protein
MDDDITHQSNFLTRDFEINSKNLKIYQTQATIILDNVFKIGLQFISNDSVLDIITCQILSGDIMVKKVNFNLINRLL